jgi:hypothetical protein
MFVEFLLDRWAPLTWSSLVSVHDDMTVVGRVEGSRDLVVGLIGLSVMAGQSTMPSPNRNSGSAVSYGTSLRLSITAFVDDGRSNGSRPRA